MEKDIYCCFIVIVFLVTPVRSAPKTIMLSCSAVFPHLYSNISCGVLWYFLLPAGTSSSCHLKDYTHALGKDFTHVLTFAA